MKVLRTLLIALLATGVLAGDTPALPPRDGWTFVAGAEDLIASGGWSCISGISTSGHNIVLTAGSSYSTQINTNGPRLAPQGDFGVLAALSPKSGSGWLTLVGVLGKDSWWNGLKRLDVGVTPTGLSISYFLGDSPSAQSVTFDGDTSADPSVLEVARLGTELAFSLNGAELGRIEDPGLFADAVYFGMNAAPNSELWISALSAAAPAGSATAILPVPFSQVIPRSGSGLRDLASSQDFLIGAAVTPGLLSNSRYASTLGAEFNLIVPENALKFDTLHPARDRYNFCPGDSLLTFATANGMKMRGHTLVWHQQAPSWVTNGKFSKEELSEILRDHILTSVSHYKGKLIAWDVVNEAINYGPPYRLRSDSVWGTTIGPDYIDKAFQWARETDPDVKLFYNDTGGEGLGAKSDAVYALAKDLKSRGIPIDGVGLQMHLSFANPIKPADLAANLQRLADLGLEVQITEMDVATPDPITPEKMAVQAGIYRDVVSACRAAANCRALLTWGISDAYSWIPSARPGNSGGLLFDQQFQPKAAYDAVKTVLTPQQP